MFDSTDHLASALQYEQRSTFVLRITHRLALCRYECTVQYSIVQPVLHWLLENGENMARKRWTVVPVLAHYLVPLALRDKHKHRDGGLLYNSALDI